MINRGPGVMINRAVRPLLALATLIALPSVVTSAHGLTRFRDCVDCVEMVAIPKGTFEMGSTLEERAAENVPVKFGDREGPRHHVTIGRAFAMSRTAITRGEYAGFVTATHRPDPPSCGVFNAKLDNWAPQPGYSWRNTGFPQTDDDPAACISWQDAHDYAAWLAQRTGKPYRLPSEEEWEYAARGGTSTIRYWGDGRQDICARVNIMTAKTVQKLGSPKSWQDKLVCASSHAFTQKVGSYAANPFGLYDMLGNVFQWVSDCYHPNEFGAPADGSSWDEENCTMRLPKGGAFHSLTWLARPAFHGGPVPPQVHTVAAGIRVVRNLP